MNGINKVYLLGHIGHDPEVRTTTGGKAVVKVSLATSHPKKVNEEWVDGVDWHRLTFFDRDAEYVARVAKKGDLLCVEAALRPNKWTDKDGQTRYDIAIVVQRINLLQSRHRAQALPDEPPAAEADGAGWRSEGAADTGAEIPF